ncbi:MerR family transcriptional regulator [Planosporangium thailandense]|uniref:MerR family transcriptional regulator n=1 Tax=Planosporangium thailandense TaxID=765197 RepID=A0ABX0Y9C6_9ACTN|nr:MerR family transcriptional regulator [Planosporangium thailandense]NJC74125.1 MerR family transcriptional regulator [Planosporangium thailandense]
MSIGEVLAHLRVDFPDTTISKLRFLESEGLVQPQRTPAGYRKYSWEDVARLRYILTAQRDHYLPLRVIRDQLAALDTGAPAADAASPGTVERSEGRGGDGSRLRPALVAVGPTQLPEPPTDLADVVLRRDELLTRAGLTEETLAALEQYGLVGERPGGGYDADALEVATVAAQLAEYGLEARHLRAYRAAADREIGLFTQLVAPLARQSNPAARARAAETVRELTACTERLRAALVRGGLRQTLGR